LEFSTHRDIVILTYDWRYFLLVIEPMGISSAF